MTRLLLVAGLVLFAAVAVACSGAGVDRSPAPTTKPADPIGDVDLAQIIEDIRTDKRGGPDRHKGRIVEVSGTVYSAAWGPDKREGVGVVVTLPDKNAAGCWFDPKSAKVALAIKKGDQVRIRGKLTGGSADKKGGVIIQVEDCELVK